MPFDLRDRHRRMTKALIRSAAEDYGSLVEVISLLLPDADVQTDNHGQVIIYTGLKIDENNELMKVKG